MVIEHTFVTTFETCEAIQQAADYLAARGFTASQGMSPTCLEMRRGQTNAARAKNVRELPQLVRMEFDRGRLNLALSIGANHAWGGASMFSITGDVAGNPRKMHLHLALLRAIAFGLEQLLSCHGPRQADYGSWDRAEAEILAAARRRNRRIGIVLLVVFGLIALVITLLVINA
jgi:hypothetical protein